MTVPEILRGSLAIGVLLGGGMAVLAQCPNLPMARNWPGRLALAHLFGAAIMAWVVTIVALVTGHLWRAPAYIVFGLLAAVSFLRQGSRNAVDPPAHASNALHVRGSTACRWWSYLAIAAILLGVIGAGWALLSGPALTMDALTMWARKAKGFFLFGSLRILWDNGANMPGFPILVPLQSWWIYAHIGAVHESWLQLNGYLFYLDAVILTYSACRIYAPSVWALMAAAFVATNPVLTLLSTHGFADGTVSAYVLPSAVCLTELLARPRERPAEVQAVAPCAILLLGALQAKNEGLSWAFLCVVVAGIVLARRRQWSTAAWLVLMVLPAQLPWTLFQRLHHLPSGSGELYATLSVIAHHLLSRSYIVLHGYLFDFRPHGLLWTLALCVPLLYASRNRYAAPMLVVMGVQLLLCCTICFASLSPWTLTYFIASRTISHIIPALIALSVMSYFRTARGSASPGSNRPSSIASGQPAIRAA